MEVFGWVGSAGEDLNRGLMMVLGGSMDGCLEEDEREMKTTN